MRIDRISYALLTLGLVATGLTPAHAQVFTPLLDTVSFSQSLGTTAAGGALFVSGNDNVISASETGTSVGTLRRFNADTGVLIGVSGQLTVANQSTTYLRTYSPEGDRLTGSYTTTWALGSLAPVTGTLQSFTSPNDSTYNSQNSWSTLALNGQALDTFVGAAPVTSRLTSTLEINRSEITDPKKANGIIQGYLVPSDNTSVANAIAGSATLDVSYRYLNHSNATFFDGVTQTDVLDAALTSGAGRQFVVAGLGASTSTTLMDFVGYSCTGSAADCASFKIDLSFSNVAAGTQVGGSILLDPNSALGTHNASFVLQFRDDDGTGSAATQRFNTLTINASGNNVAAVPEPHSAAMLLAGLGAIACMSRRRRRASDQVAKL
ncbi:MAG: hypothetical protein RL375_4048 [Pseudomonadota bacterium]